MNLFGLQISRVKSAVKAAAGRIGDAVAGDRGWFRVIGDYFPGAWQMNAAANKETLLTFSALYSAVTIIASDIAKLRPRIVQEDSDGICTEVKNSPLSRVLVKPNKFQNRIKFIEQWIVSKLLHGNTYVLLQRDARRVVVAMYILDPQRVTPLVAENGDVYYRLKKDKLAPIAEDDTVAPASMIIHDMMVSLFHPLVGVTPIYACAQSVTMGATIQRDSTRFFKNAGRPGGQLTAPGTINDETAARLKAHFEENFTGENVGRLLVSGDGLTYEAMPTIPAVDAQLIEQLRWTVEDVARCFHVPMFKLGVPVVSGNGNQQSLEALNQSYYSDCLQSLIESMEVCLDEGLALPTGYYADIELDGLLRMDQAAQIKAYTESVSGGIHSPNEARKKFNLPPVPGGESPYLQQQNYSLAALAKRDAAADPFANGGSGSTSNAATAAEPVASAEDEAAAALEAAEFIKEIQRGLGVLA